jgi:urease accessory protein
MTRVPALVRRFLACSVGALAAAVLAAAPAGAHVGSPTSGLADGLLHPLTGPDHLLAMLSVGVVSACGSVGFRWWWLAPAAFLGGMTSGGIAGFAGWGIPQAELVIVLSVIALGLVVGGAIGTPGAWLVPVLVLAGIAHGNAHGLEAPASAHPALYIGGFLGATVALHATGAIGGHLIRGHMPSRVVFGAATAGAGIALLGIG